MVGYIIGMIIGAIAILIGILALLFILIRNNQFKKNIKRIGTTAENQINDDLRTWAKHTNNYFINASLYKYSINKVFEVDSILVTDKALIVIEIKSIKGQISGNSTSPTWIKGLGEVKHAISNPILQNDRHIEHIVKATDIKVPTVSLIVFSNRANDVNISNVPPHVVITRHAELFEKLEEINSSLPVSLSKYDMKTITASIKAYRTNKSEDIKLHKKITNRK